MKVAIDSSDGIIIGSENISPKIDDYLKKYKNPLLEFQPLDSFTDPYLEFYNNLF